MDLFGQRYRGYTMDWTVQEQYQTFIFKIGEIKLSLNGTVKQAIAKDIEDETF